MKANQSFQGESSSASAVLDQTLLKKSCDVTSFLRVVWRRTVQKTLPKILHLETEVHYSYMIVHTLLHLD